MIIFIIIVIFVVGCKAECIVIRRDFIIDTSKEEGSLYSYLKEFMADDSSDTQVFFIKCVKNMYVKNYFIYKIYNDEMKYNNILVNGKSIHLPGDTLESVIALASQDTVKATYELMQFSEADIFFFLGIKRKKEVISQIFSMNWDEKCFLSDTNVEISSLKKMYNIINNNLNYK
jgi:hypothetical protein